MDANANAVEANAIAEGAKKCPECKELIKKDATVCKHCGFKLVEKSEANGRSAEIIDSKTNGNIWEKERDLTNDEYQVHLVKKYSVEKNDALGKIIANGKLFVTVEDALKAMNLKEADEHSEFIKKAITETKEFVKNKGSVGKGSYEFTEYGDGTVVARHQSGITINFKSLADAKSNLGE
jgi:hypothetical protein